MHVLADALTSVLAIIALLTGKFFGLIWMDPLMGIVGALLVSRWSWGLLKDSSNVLLDMQVSPKLRNVVRKAIEEKDDNRIADLHLWSIGPGIYSTTMSIISDDPKSPEYYKELIPNHMGIVHSTVEVHQCRNSTS